MKTYKLFLLFFIVVGLLAPTSQILATQEETSKQQALRYAKGAANTGLFVTYTWIGYRIVKLLKETCDQIDRKRIIPDDKAEEKAIAMAITSVAISYLTYAGYKSLKHGLKNFKIWPLSKAE